MATPIVSDPAPSINPSFSVHPDLSQMNANDQLIESLQKAVALTSIFAASSLGDYEEDMLQMFSVAILDNLYAASEALEFLRKRRNGFL
jgi:hypothetical protein